MTGGHDPDATTVSPGDRRAVPDPAAWGVATWFTDAFGSRRDVPAATVEAVLAAMDARTPAPEPATGPMVVRLDRPPVAVPAGRLITEDGASVRVEGALPRDLGPGYHRLEPDDGAPRRLVASPGRCPAPPYERQWGWAAQLYATRSRASWGIGDLADLAELARWSASLGAGMALINPLHAGAPGARQEPSPYFPSSRCFLSPLYLRVEDLPGAPDLPAVTDLAAAGRALNHQRMIDRDRVWALKLPAFEALFARFEERAPCPEFDRFVRAGGASLQGFATWCALAERHGVPWQDWPADVRRPDGAGVGAFAATPEAGRRIRFHAWLQWQLDRQLMAASAPVGLMQDLAIGVSVGGADSWLWQDAFAETMRVGAPPDEFNTQGQDWGLPPWDPWKLRSGDYEPFIQTIRAGLVHAGGLRIDHVMGLFRLWWIPEGRPPGEGAYIRYPAADLLDIVALEAHRAGAYIVGEDLGTVEDHVRAELAERRVLSYRLFWFEVDRPDHWPAQALGAVTTHDLPTVAGAWSGSDLANQRDLGLAPNEEGLRAMRGRLADWTHSGDDTPVDDVVVRTYGLLAEAPCAVLTATLDDVCGVEERPNMPGTTHQWPNWNLALPVPLEAIEQLPVAREVAERLSRRGPGDGVGAGAPEPITVSSPPVDLPVMPPVAPMLAKLTRDLPTAPGMLYEPKWDGFRCIVFRDGDEVVLASRNERPLTRYFPEVVAAVRAQLPGRVVLDGEIVIAGPGGLDFDALSQRIHPAASRVQMLAETTPASLVAFDLLALDRSDLRGEPFTQRREWLSEVMAGVRPPVHLTPATTDRDVAADWFARFEGAGLDGVVAKPGGLGYLPDQRAMFKIKHERTADFVVAGFRWYRANDVGEKVGSLMLGLYDDQERLHHVGVIGSFPSAERTHLVEVLAPYRIDDDPSHPWAGWAGPDDSGTRQPGATSRWNAKKDLSFELLRPELVVEAAYEHLQGQRLRHTARFRRWRPDRLALSATYDQLDVAVPSELADVFAAR